MTRAEVEAKVIELIYQRPFMPFQVEMTDGTVIVVPHPRLAVNETGAGFFGPDGGLVDINFDHVRAFRYVQPKVAI